PARIPMRRDRGPGGGARLLQNPQDRVSGAGSQVEHVRGSATREVLERGDVGSSQIRYVDVVADAGAVPGRVVVAVDRRRRRLAQSDLEEARDQMLLGMVPLSHARLRVGAGGVEIAQRNRTEPVRG